MTASMAIEAPPPESNWEPIPFDNADYKSLPTEEKFEEELINEGPVSERYYPVQIGQVLDSRYQICGKVGYGIASTVWLARDLQWARFVYPHWSTYS